MRDFTALSESLFVRNNSLGLEAGGRDAGTGTGRDRSTGIGTGTGTGTGTSIDTGPGHQHRTQAHNLIHVLSTYSRTRESGSTAAAKCH